MTQYLKTAGGTLASDVTGAGQLIVLAPGIGNQRTVYRRLAPLLATAGYRVAQMDIRGHGESRSPRACATVECEPPAPQSAAWWQASSSAWARFTAPSAIPTISEMSTSARSSSHGLTGSTPRNRPPGRSGRRVRCDDTAPACPTIPSPDASGFRARCHRLRFFAGKAPRPTSVLSHQQTDHRSRRVLSVDVVSDRPPRLTFAEADPVAAYVAACRRSRVGQVPARPGRAGLRGRTDLVRPDARAGGCGHTVEVLVE